MSDLTLQLQGQADGGWCVLCPQGCIAANTRSPAYIHIFNTPPRCVPSDEDSGKTSKVRWSS